MSLKCHKVLLLTVVIASGALEVLEDGQVSVRPDNLDEVERSWWQRVAREGWRQRVAVEGRRPPAPARVVNNYVAPARVVNNHVAPVRVVTDHVAPARVANDHVTMAPLEPECLYQYPERKQLDGMLSNMMNELTKMFVQVHQLATKQDNRNGTIKRFRVRKKKNMQFFEEIFKNMSANFRRFSNQEMLRIPPPHDTCASQERLKTMWKDLLESAVSNVRHATLLCVAEFLRVQHRSKDGATRRRLGKFLTVEMARVRSNQLSMLCDQFQLCYSDLL